MKRFSAKKMVFVSGVTLLSACGGPQTRSDFASPMAAVRTAHTEGVVCVKRFLARLSPLEVIENLASLGNSAKGVVVSARPGSSESCGLNQRAIEVMITYPADLFAPGTARRAGGASAVELRRIDWVDVLESPRAGYLAEIINSIQYVSGSARLRSRTRMAVERPDFSELEYITIQETQLYLDRDR